MDEKIQIVKDMLEGERVALGFSGGADSTLIAYLSSKAAEDTLAITIDNHLMPKGFIEHARKTAESFKIRHMVIDIDFNKNEDFLSNDSRRCFNCRKLMYSKIKQTALENGFEFICDGNNISDLVVDRPGILVTYEMGFKTPLIDARLTSKEIHQYLNENSISYSRSTTCLATRLPLNTKTTKEKIDRISLGEDYIMENTSCEIVKLRDLGELALLEVDEITEIIKDDKFTQINDELKHHGFKKVALNLTPIDDNEYIKLDYDEGSFSYRLPFNINLENTEKQLGEIENKNQEKIEAENITIFKDGVIEGRDFKSYDAALAGFMDILTRLRREV